VDDASPVRTFRAACRVTSSFSASFHERRTSHLLLVEDSRSSSPWFVREASVLCQACGLLSHWLAPYSPRWTSTDRLRS
jgi:hypothetical protein